MTNFEKAREIANHTECNGLACWQCKEYVALKMAQYKDDQHTEEKQQWIEKACEWLKDNIHDYYMTGEFEQWFDDMFDDFKEAMEGGDK